MVSPASLGPRAGRSPPWFQLYRSSLHLVQGSSSSGLRVHVPGTLSSEDPTRWGLPASESLALPPLPIAAPMPGRKAYCPPGPGISAHSLRRCTPASGASRESLGWEGPSPAHEPACASPRLPDSQTQSVTRLCSWLPGTVTSGEQLQHGRCHQAAPARPRGVKAWTSSPRAGPPRSAQRKGPEEGGGPAGLSRVRGFISSQKDAAKNRPSG